MLILVHAINLLIYTLAQVMNHLHIITDLPVSASVHEIHFFSVQPAAL